MEITLLAVIALFLTGYVALVLFAMLRIRSFINDIRDFVTPPDDKTESTASLLYGVLIKRLATELKVTIMGTMGGEAKGKAYAEQAMMSEMVEAENPTLAAVMSAFPSLGKTFKKNPALLNFALSKIAGAKQVAVQPASGSGGSGFGSNSNKYG